jgi:hypothetical protein
MATAKSSSARATRERTAASGPHSWELKTWPRDVWPHDQKRGQWIARAYRQELVAADAMSRIGKILVFSGAKYTRWLESRAHHVVEFQSNNPAIGKSALARSRNTST